MSLLLTLGIFNTPIHYFLLQTENWRRTFKVSNTNKRPTLTTITPEWHQWSRQVSFSLMMNIFKASVCCWPPKWDIKSRDEVLYSSNRSQKFFKLVAFKNFAIFTGKHFRWSLFSITFWAVRREKRLQFKSVPVNIVKFLGTAFLQNISGDCFCL